MRKRRSSWPDASAASSVLGDMLRHFREISYAISYLHGMEPPVVHRDLNLGMLQERFRSPG